MVGNFLGSIGEIAMGNIGAAANALENGLATALTLVISFLAKLIHLDGVTAKIRAALNKIRGKVENMMAKVAKWIAKKGEKFFGTIKNVAGKVQDTLFNWLGIKKRIKTKNDGTHTLFVKEVGGKPKSMVASQEMTTEQKLVYFSGKVSTLSSDDDKQYAREQIKLAEQKKQALDTLVKEVDAEKNLPIGKKKHGTADMAQKKISIAQEALAPFMISLFNIFGADPAVLGPGAKVQVGDTVAAKISGVSRGMVVKRIKQYNTRTETSYIQVQMPGESVTYSLFYNDYGAKWDQPSKPVYMLYPVTNYYARVIVDNNPSRKGKTANVPQSVRSDPSSGYGGIWVHGGHLVANRFGGGSYADGNIVPMTIHANETSAGIKKMENPIAKDIEQNDAVYDYSAKAIFDRSKQIAPIIIEVRAQRLYPDQNKPTYVTLSHDVDNTK